MTHPLLDPEPISATRFDALAGAVGRLLETRHDVLLTPGEAIVPLEAAARGVGRPGLRVLNLVTSPYGRAFGRWLREAGADVVEIEAAAHRAIEAGEVRRAFADHPDLAAVSFVHVEAVSGVHNDAEAICAIAREHGAMVILDAVASAGAHDLRLDEWGVDLAVVGPQKAFAGPAGISIAVVSGAAWRFLAQSPTAPRGSVLSLLDWKERWIDTDRRVIPGIVAPLEVLALEAAVARLESEGLAAVRLRHRAAAAASRAGVRSLGLHPYVSDEEAAVTVTTVRPPVGESASALVDAARAGRDVALSAGFGDLVHEVMRIDHTGQRARLEVVRNALTALAAVIDPDRASLARDAADRAWRESMRATTIR